MKQREFIFNFFMSFITENRKVLLNNEKHSIVIRTKINILIYRFIHRWKWNSIFWIQCVFYTSNSIFSKWNRLCTHRWLWTRFCKCFAFFVIWPHVLSGDSTAKAQQTRHRASYLCLNKTSSAVTPQSRFTW